MTFIKKSSKTIIIFVGQALLVSCGSSNDASDNTTWRLSSFDLKEVSGDNVCISQNAITYNYNENDELVEITTIPVEPFESCQSLQKPLRGHNQKNKLASSLNALASGGYATKEVLESKIEISILSVPDWTEEQYWLIKSTFEGNETVAWEKTGTVQYLDWGDRRNDWGIISPEWKESETISTTDIMLDEEFEPVEWVVTEGDTPPEPSLMEFTTEGSFVKKYQREYNAAGYLVYRATFSDDETQLLFEDVLKYSGTQNLTTITSYRYPPETGAIGATNNLGVIVTEKRFNFTPENTLVIDTYIDKGDGLEIVASESARYERAPCGPITYERSKKVLLDKFPVCFNR